METITFEEPLVITATPPKPAPVIVYAQPALANMSLPPMFKVSNAVNFIGAGILWWAGWKKSALLFGSLSVVDVIARQLSRDYAKETEQFYGWRR